MNKKKTKFRSNVRGNDETEEMVRAIRHGAVDAFVVEEPEGHRVYTLEGADLPYSLLVERMQQGAAMLGAQSDIIYCNLSLAHLLGKPRETLIGLPLQDLLAPADQASCKNLLREVAAGSSEGEMRLRRADGTLIFARFSFQLLSRDKSTSGVLISDLTAQKHLEELTSRLQRVQDDERRRIARELHDSVGQLLAAISMNISTVQSQSHNLNSDAARAVSDNAKLVDRVSTEIRTISYLLHPPLLEIAGLATALRWYVDGFSERSRVKVDLDIPDGFRRLPDDMEIAIFRIVQECLTNIHRHSGSATASIRIHEEGNHLIVQVQDSGKGIPAEKQQNLAAAGGVGFGGIRERLRQFGGSLEVRSGGSGTVVSATLITTASVSKQVA